MKIFIINLLRSTHRKESMKEQISKLFSENPSLKDRLEFIFLKLLMEMGERNLPNFTQLGRNISMVES
ncbi:hypothetical protein [Campylobacter upsaliensis]|uniref:hypothetical protein n=1 Tax=Campylobacter upsaliensis TaxID=28080 RepID=UPI001FD0D562|nr:hypothetical protein [Campylobacter upsaliensis]